MLSGTRDGEQVAQYNLDSTYKQSTTENHVTFSDSYGWEYTPGPKEIDIQSYDGNAKTYVNAYVSYLQGETGDSVLTVTLITLAELKNLGCTATDDYSYTSVLTCINSANADWLVNGQYTWTHSAILDGAPNIWAMNTSGDLFRLSSGSIRGGIRPVITISKEFIQ